MKCPECKREFDKERPWQRYCSAKCGERQRYKRRARRVRKALAMAEDAAVRDFGSIGR
jgi:hypothetical protein